MKNSDNMTLHDVILSGGPPWGFTLTGGSEFGSMLCVSKITDDEKAGSLHTGDHILSVNGISCTSRSNAIQMVRTIDEQLRLKVCRRNNGGRKGDLSLEEETFPLDTAYVVVDEMNEVSKGLKGSRVNEWNYKIISINKDEKTNQHSIRIGIDDALLYRNNEGNCKDVGHDAGRISDHLTSVAQQQLTVKMMPSVQGGPRITKCNARTYSTDDSHLVCPNARDENVEAEPCKRVSTARAMFENMSSAPHHFTTKSQSKQQLKSWNSSSLLDFENDKSSTVVKSPKSFHEHSKSLPLDISEQGPCKQPTNFSTASITISSKHKTNVDNDRPKSAFVYDGKKRGITTDIDNETPSVHTASHSEIITCTNLEEQMSTIASYSSEDLRHYGKDNVDARGRLPSNSASKNHSANELRQAASKYHQELIKNYPKYRNTITGKDNAHKFTARKVSMPTEEPFARGESARATIATSSVARMPRSHSTNDSIGIKDLSEVLSKSSENSMMSRLLRDQSNPATLMKIDEEIKLASATVGKSVKVLIRRNSLDGSQQTNETCVNMDNRQRAASSHSMGSIGTPYQHEATEKHVFVDRQHRYTGSKSTGSILPQVKSISVQTDAMSKRKESERSTCRRTSSESSQDGDVKMKQATLSDSCPTRKDDINAATNTSLQHTLSPHSSMDLKHSTNNSSSNNNYNNNNKNNNNNNNNNSNNNSDNNSNNNNNNNNNNDDDNSHDINANSEATTDTACMKIPLYTHTETDIDGDDPSEIPPPKDASIDGDEACDIIHQKDASTDSAVYVLDEQISHVKALSNEGTECLQQYSDLTYKQYNEGGYLPTSDDILTYPYHGDDVNEKEKPQRTINRRKKDSTFSSRNTSCVSTDSTTSTATVDSGIVVQTDLTQQTGYNKDLNGSRETLDDDVAALSDESLLMSTPERNEEAKNAGYQLLGKSYGNLLNQSPSSSGEHSRRDSLQSPRTADLDDEKAKLVGSMREKISELRDQEQEIADEIKMNEELGKKVLTMVKCKATHNEFTKFELFIGELNKIVKLLLSLTQRLHRYELMLQDLDMSNEADKAKKDGLISKIDKLKSQHEEACYLRDVNDKRGDAVASFLGKYCTEEEFADFQYYVDMKSQLALMQSEIREKVKLGEERLKALELTTSEWYK